jgi:hypothetical protein
MTENPFVGNVEDAPALGRAESGKLGFDLDDLRGRKTLDDRRIQTAQLRHMKEGPGTSDRVGRFDLGNLPGKK